MLEVKVKKTLADFQLDVEITADREILSILGASGSGKTMTLLCAAGLLRPDQGSVKLNGRVLYCSQNNIYLPPRERNIGFVFQNYALFPHLTVKENIAYGIGRLKKTEQAERVSELLEIMNIPGLVNRYPAELSSGQQQRVALARAIAPEPEALLLDEPFSALDTFRRERLEIELLNLQQFFKGDILFVTHDLAQGYKLGNRIALYDDGRIIQCDRKDTVIAQPGSLPAAKLTGVKNIFSGRITAIRENLVELFIPAFGQTIAAKSYKAAGLRLNQTVHIGIRPEQIVLTTATGENTLDCLLDQVVDGVTNINYYYYAVKDGEKKVKLECSAPRPFNEPCLKRGLCVRLYLPPERLTIFPGKCLIDVPCSAGILTQE